MIMSTTPSDVDTEKNHKEPAHCSWLERVRKVVIIVSWALLLFCRYFPLTILSITFTGKILAPLDQREEEETKSSPPPKKKRATQHVQSMIQRWGVVIATRLGVVSILWLVINLSVPSIRKDHFLGHPLWKWSVLVILIFLLIPSMLVVSYIFNKFLEKWGTDDDDLKLYWIKGVSVSMRRVLYFALILHIWIFYFTVEPPPFLSRGGYFYIYSFERRKVTYIPSFRKKTVYKSIHEYIFLTLIAFLLWAVIGLIANILVLWWKSSVIYNPNKARILAATFRLYLLHLLFGQIEKHVNHTRWMLMPYLVRGTPLEQVVLSAEDPKMTSLGVPVHCPPIERFMDEMSKYVSLYDVHDAVQWFNQQNFDSSHDEISGVHQLLPAIRKKYRPSGNPQKTSDDETCADMIIKNVVPEKDIRELLLKLLRLDLMEVREVPNPNEGEKISWSSIEAWMKFAHKKCFAYMSKIHGELQLADTLHSLLSGFQIVATFILWLFVTKLATTRLVITLGSLFVGLSFMFTTTCKAFVQGVAFSFYIHPFDVGDLVEINKTKLEVQKITILTTSFRILEKENKDQMIIYPNSVMAKEKIIKLKEDEGVSHKNDGDSKDDET